MCDLLFGIFPSGVDGILPLWLQVAFSFEVKLSSTYCDNCAAMWSKCKLTLADWRGGYWREVIGGGGCEGGD